MTLSVKYAIRHKIGIANWCPSTHGSGLSPTLASLLYQIGTRSTFDYGVFVFNQLLQHVNSFAIKLLVGFHRLFSGILLAQYPTILGPIDALSSDFVVLNLNYKFFQGSHVSDIVHNIYPCELLIFPCLIICRFQRVGSIF